MSDIQKQIEDIEKEIRETPYHKATEHHIGKLRARLSKLKDREIESYHKHGGGGGSGYAVKKQGDATIVFVGPPSVGKSTLLNILTNAQSKVAPYAFTTVNVIPGMMEYKDARIQILDVPGLIKGAEEGKGRGREVLSVVRGCDLLLIMTDVDNLDAIERISATLERNGIRINKYPPSVIIDKKLKGGILIHSNVKQELSEATIKEVAQEFGLRNVEITIREKLSLDTLIDAFARNRVYISSIVIINKIDKLPDENLDNFNQAIKISAENNIGIAKLKDSVWESLNFVRVYLVKADEEPGFNNSLIMKSNQTLYDVVEKIGTEFAESKISAKIWGKGAKFPGQEVSLATQVQEGLQVRFI